MASPSRAAGSDAAGNVNDNQRRKQRSRRCRRGCLVFVNRGGTRPVPGSPHTSRSSTRRAASRPCGWTVAVGGRSNGASSVSWARAVNRCDRRRSTNASAAPRPASNRPRRVGDGRPVRQRLRGCASMSDRVRLEVDGAVRTVTLDPAREGQRHGRRDAARAGGGVRPVARSRRRRSGSRSIRAEGRVFCAGLDLRGDLGKDQDVEVLFHRVETWPLPVVAVVQGAAIAGGNELALHCDLVVASDRGPLRHVAGPGRAGAVVVPDQEAARRRRPGRDPRDPAARRPAAGDADGRPRADRPLRAGRRAGRRRRRRSSTGWCATRRSACGR